MAISSRARADLFPLRAELFMYWEDIELSFRARERGWRMGVAYDLVAVHDEGGSSAVGRGRSALFHYFQSRNRLIVLADRGYSPVKLFAASIPYSVSALVSIVRTDEHAWRNAKSLVRGTMKGIGYVIAKHRVLRRLATHA